MVRIMKNSKFLPALLPLRCVAFFIVFLLGSVLTVKNVESISNWWSVVASVVNILTIVFLVVIAKRQGKSFFEFLNYKNLKDLRIKFISVFFRIKFSVYFRI